MPSKLIITLLLPLSLAVIFSGCKKSDNAKPTKPSYTAKMGGIRNWHGSHYYQASGMHYPTPVNVFYYFPDTSFAITIVNDSVIQFGNSVFQYEQTDTPRQIYFFGTAYFYYEYNMGTGVAWYYAKDSLVYCNGDRHATSDQWVLQDLYYTY